MEWAGCSLSASGQRNLSVDVHAALLRPHRLTVYP